ncbi:Clavaminate synthase-like protein [Auriscalpium vulgare]|uniref:Clavaminate synthase-like protein n=1 Tax=Auriscalpium vulgare TaxID=40419 RepID=A0ACB8RA73_9AGAM|nr:Clavaminate synthase-like protein [Auriscalpium vulgare]
MSEPAFTAVPVLDYALLADDTTRPTFIAQLRHALINVGFLYLANPPVAPATIDAVVAFLPRVFALPQPLKDAVRMSNSEHFLGYSRLGVERTRGAADQREQFDFATPHENTWAPGRPDYLRLWGPSQWPDEHAVPGFKAAFLAYLADVEALSYAFIALIAEALGVPPAALTRFYDAPERMQHRAKIVKYPARPTDAVSAAQGVGPHFDAGFLTFLLQASDHPGLQVQNLAGAWIDVPPKPHTFVVNIGKALEAVTQGLARATSHRVLAPPVGSTPRYSVPFFQNIAQDLRIGEMTLDFPEEVLQLKERRGELGATDSVNFSEYGSLPSGQVTLIGRVKSHPDVAQRHYPDLFRQFFPDGLPEYGEAY